MMIRLRDKLLGGHCHTAVFVGKDWDHLQKTGDLCMDIDEWILFGATLRLGAVATHDRVIVDMPDSDKMAEAIMAYNAARENKPCAQ